MARQRPLMGRHLMSRRAAGLLLFVAAVNLVSSLLGSLFGLDARWRGADAVRLDRSVDGLRVVKTGLKPGDNIVTQGLQRVRPGIKVVPTTARMASR